MLQSTSDIHSKAATALRSRAPKKGGKTAAAQRRDLASKAPHTVNKQFRGEARERYLNFIREGYGLTKAAALAGFAYSTVRIHRQADPAFEEALGLAVVEGTMALEDEARRRAVGYQEQVIHNGVARWQTDPATGELLLDADGKPIPLTKTSQSDILLMFALKARDPHRFADHSRVETTNINIDVTVPELQQGLVGSLRAMADRLKAGSAPKAMIDVTPKQDAPVPVNVTEPGDDHE